jgi:hypothetical protein
MSTGPYDLALANKELQQMAAAEDEMRRDMELSLEKNKDIYRQKKEITEELMGKLSAIQKKHIQMELDQWEKGQDNIPVRTPLDDITRRIKQRYNYKEEDIL